jgi:hypothetical protein
VYGADVDPETATVPEAKVGTLGGASDPSADLDLVVNDADGEVVRQSGGPTADQSVSLADPAADTTVSADVTVAAAPSEGRDIFAEARCGCEVQAGRPWASAA